MKKRAHHSFANLLSGCGSVLVVVGMLFAGCRRNETGGSHTEPAQGDTVSVLFYNVQNFHDLVDNGAEYAEYKPGQSGWNEFAFRVKLHNIATVLESADAHIAALCEVENENVVRELQRELKARGRDYGYYACGNLPNATNTLPAVLSRYPIAAQRGIATVKTGNYYSRNILETDIVLGRDTLKLFVNHWPSKHHPESFRVAAAQALAARIAELPPRTDYLVVGDLNEDYNECEIFNTAGFNNTRGMTGINHVMKTVKSSPGGFVEYVRKHDLKPGDRLHYNLWLEHAEENRGSYKFRGQWTTPDHILVPASLYDEYGISYVDNSFGVITLDGKLLRGNEPFGWQFRFKGRERYHRGEGFSDHLPVTARLVCGPFVPSGDDLFADTAVGDTTVLGFESGCEGWIGMLRGVTVRRDTVQPYAGRYCLRVEGTAGKNNASVARARIPYRTLGVHRPREAVLMMRGMGWICVRVRQAGNEKWRYFTGDNFEITRQARYLPVRFDSWKRIRLDVRGLAAPENEMEMEIRAKKEEPVALWIDNVHFL